MVDAAVRRRLLEIILCLLGWLPAAVAMTPGVWAGGYHWDESFSEYIPWRVELGRLLAGGELPFFTPRVFAGMPLFSTAYVGVLYPPNWLYAVCPPEGLSNWLELLHGLAGALGMYLYLRARRLVPVAAFAGGLFHLCSLFMLSHLPHVSMREAALMAPWVAWLGWRLLRAPGPGRAAALAAATGLHIAIGYQQIFLFTVLWLGLDWLGMVRWSRRGLRATAWMAVAGVVGVLLMMVQILPSLAHLSETPRGNLTIKDWMACSMPPDQLLQMLSPRSHGGVGPYYTGADFPAELIVTIPVAGWVLAVAGIALAWGTARGRRSPATRTFLVYTPAIVVAVLLSLGGNFPPYRFLFEVPPFSLFRVPARWMFLAGTGGIVLAAWGVQGLLRLRWSWRIALLVGSWGAWSGAMLALHRVVTGDSWATVLGRTLVAGGTSADHMDNLLQRLGLPRMDGFLDAPSIHLLVGLAATGAFLLPRRRAILMALPLVLLFALNQMILQKQVASDAVRRDQITGDDSHPLLDHVDESSIQRLYMLSPDGLPPGEPGFPDATFLYRGLPALSGYCPLLSRRLEQVFGIGQAGVGYRDGELLANPAALRHLAVSHVIARPGQFTPDQRIVYTQRMGHDFGLIAWADGCQMVELLGTRPRFDLARRWRTAGSKEYWRGLLDEDPNHPRWMAVLEEPRKDLLPPENDFFEPGSVTVLEDGANRQRVRVASPAGTVLLVRDVWWPGWLYRIPGHDGEWRTVRRANGLLRYVPVPAGEWTVEMRYRPPKLRLGILLSGLGFGALVILVLLERRRRVLRPLRSAAD